MLKINTTVLITTMLSGILIWLAIRMMSRQTVNPSTGRISTSFMGFNEIDDFLGLND